MSTNAKHVLNYDGSVTVYHPVRFNDWVAGEFEAICSPISQIDQTEEPLLYEMVSAMDDAQVVIKRRGNNTNEVFLRLEVVEVFAREVAYYLEHNEEIRKESFGSDPCLNKVITGCRNALANANKVLEGAGLQPITSYFQDPITLSK